MSTETGPDRPPQRTVAELLAAHGGGQPTSGRRRARRDPADDGSEPPGLRSAESPVAAPQAEGGRRAWAPGGDAPAGTTGGQGNAGWPGAQPAGVDRPESLNWRGPAQPPPDPRLAPAQPHPPSRREIREAREASLSQLEGMAPLQGQVQGRVDGQAQVSGLQSSPPAPRFVENPTDEIPPVVDQPGANGANGRRAASTPTDDRPAAPPRRARIAHDAGPATGAMTPEDLLADEDDDEAQDEVKILGRSLTDLEANPTVDGSDANGYAADSGSDDAPARVSRMSRRSTMPKRGFRLPGRSKADAEETVLTAARPPSAPASASASAPISTPTDVDVDQDEDAFTPDPPAVGGGDWGARKAPIGGFAPVGADAPTPADVPAGLADKTEVAFSDITEPRADRAAATKSSPAKAWLVIIAQLVGGAVAGAALWVAFRYLWGKLPPVALGAAVLATAGSVLLVRAIRRSDDLRTSLFAVLVGLVVTVSPAVLVLVSR